VYACLDRDLEVLQVAARIAGYSIVRGRQRMTGVPVPSSRSNLPVEASVALGPQVPPAQRSSGIQAAGSAASGSAAGGALEFERVYTEHFHHVTRWARAFGGLEADVDDLAQEVFLVVRRKLDQFDGRSMPAWLYGITRKTVSDYRRRAWLRRLLHGVTRSLDATRDDAISVQGIDVIERLEAQRILRRVLERMSQVRRAAFILFEIEGYSGDEIAELEQIPLATVYTRLHHARKDFLRLTAELTGQQPEEPPL
jgi:RNA polymerase sigma-70 factor, ECF subfamily